ncbi:MAG: FHA domain-containing protein, partial [Gammaproteobacteria bacterium]|nr:FHA domain-containing protein [Gammaproteobacteria bacterium]
MSLFSELKRRNVFKIGVAYLIVAWLLMQVTDLAAPRLFLPEWVPTFVVFILALGFPVALLLAWAYE